MSSDFLILLLCFVFLRICILLSEIFHFVGGIDYTATIFLRIILVHTLGMDDPGVDLDPSIHPWIYRVHVLAVGVQVRSAVFF